MITGKIENNKFIPDNPELFRLEFEKRNGSKVRIEVKRLGGKLKQFAYIYGVLYPAFMELGYTNYDDVDKDLKELFFFEHSTNKLTGEIEKRLKSKSKASKEDISKFISDCVMFGNAEHNLNILSSEEYFQT